MHYMRNWYGISQRLQWCPLRSRSKIAIASSFLRFLPQCNFFVRASVKPWQVEVKVKFWDHSDWFEELKGVLAFVLTILRSLIVYIFNTDCYKAGHFRWMIMTHVWLLCLLFILLISEKNKKEDKKEKEEKPPTVSLLQLVNIVLKRALSSHHPTSSCTLHWPRHLSVTDTAVKNPKDCFNFSHPDVKLQPHKTQLFSYFYDKQVLNASANWFFNSFSVCKATCQFHVERERRRDAFRGWKGQ